MLYISPFKNFRQKVTEGIPERHPVTADIIGWKVQPLAANFGRLGDEQAVFNPLTGEMVMVADITTGVYDTEVAQATNHWTDDERMMVERKLDEVAEKIPAYVRKLTPVHVAAPPPWQTFDSTAPTRVTAIATELDLIPEALRYERENLDRDTVVAELEKAMSPEDASRAKPLERIDVEVPKPSMRIQKPPKSTRSGIPLDTPGIELKESPEPEPVAGGTVVL